MNEPLYTIEILRLAASIPHLSPLQNPQGSAEVRSPTCGSTVRAQVVLDGGGRVLEFGQQIEACAFGQASAALLGVQVMGRTDAEIAQALADLTGWLEGTREDPGAWPDLSALTPARTRRARHGAILLPFRALLAAIRDAGAAAR